MKTVRVILPLWALFIQTPWNFGLGWLLYNHVHATDLMWFMWWLSVPLALVGLTLGLIVSANSGESK